MLIADDLIDIVIIIIPIRININSIIIIILFYYLAWTPCKILLSSLLRLTLQYGSSMALLKSFCVNSLQRINASVWKE